MYQKVMCTYPYLQMTIIVSIIKPWHIGIYLDIIYVISNLW